MTSVLPEEETKVSKMRQKLMNKVPVKEETRSFLRFSRENLSISQSELEQGFDRRRFRPSRHTVLSVAALVIALLCLGLELWKLRYASTNRREIEELKKDVESLKHRLLEEDLLNELKAFEEQLYAQDSDDDDADADEEDPGETDIDNADYDSSYDEESSSHEYSQDPAPSYGARPSDFLNSSSTISPVPSPPEPQEGPDKSMLEFFASFAKHVEKHEKHRKISDDQEPRNSTKQKRDVLALEDSRKPRNLRFAPKRRRSVGKNHARMESFDQSAEEAQNTSMEVRSRHPPKKYKAFSRERQDPTDDQSAERQLKKSARNLRKNSRTSRAVVAAHFGADRGKLGTKDAEHFGNGRVRHFDTVFKAWSPSHWVEGLRMNQHLEMKENGSLVVHQDGLYLVYAQIFYIDDRNQAGFHLKVNNQAILHCSVMNNHGGRGNTGTQSCFSAQVTLLHKNDVLVLQEASDSSRFTLLEAEKTFLGLVRLGDKPR